MIAIMWQFDVKNGHESEFERMYRLGGGMDGGQPSYPLVLGNAPAGPESGVPLHRN